MQYAYEKQIGIETICGTDWPVRVVVYGSGEDWTCAKVCNGVARGAFKFNRRKHAIEFAEQVTA